MTRPTLRGSRQQLIHPILRFFCGEPAMNSREAGNSSLGMGDAATPRWGRILLISRYPGKRMIDPTIVVFARGLVVGGT